MNILHITGLEYSQKYGGFERWLIAFGKQIKDQNGTCFITYSKKLISDPILLKDLDQNNIIQILLPDDSIKKLEQIITKNNIKVIHCHFENTQNFLQPAKKLGCQVYWHLHCENYYSYNNNWKKNIKLYLGVQLFKFKFWKLQFYVDKLFYVSKGVESGYRSFFGWKKNKGEVSYLGLLQSQLDNKQKMICNNTIVITCIAFHSHIKGIDVLIKAAALLKERGYEFVIKQIGTGLISRGNIDTLELQNLAKNLNVDKNIEWLGLRSDITEILLQSDIYCQPSRSEALAFTLMEAMSCHLPIVASKVGGIPEVVTHNFNGLLVNPSDANQLATALKELIENKKLRQKLGEASFIKIKDSQFITENSIQKIIRHYKK